MALVRAFIYAALLVFAASPTLAQRVPSPGTGTSRIVPGPVAGVGLPALAVVGGYIWFVRRKRQAKAKKHAE
jgi:hypothetical protein